MSNLKDLFISQSFYGIINLENSTSPITSQSGDVELQDGIGTNLGLRTNADNKKFTVVNNFQVDGNADFNGDIDISGSFVHTGSIDVIGNVTVNGDISANIATFDTVNTRLLHVTEESASVIFSSGSNVIGDDITDVQTIVGQTTISGSLGVTGTQTNTGNLDVSGEISSSTVNGIGNVTTYSASVDSRLDALEGPFSTSVDSRLDSLETFETSQQVRNSVLGTYTSSVDSSLASINSFTSSTESSLNSLNSFSSSTDSSLTSINAFTSSANQRLDSLEAFTQSLSADFVETATFNSYTSSINAFTASTDNRLTQIELTTASLQNEVDSLIAVTGSYATTGSNTFVGDQTISGSVNGNVEAITIASQTASIDCGLGNFFTVTLPTGSDTHFTATNIIPGQTISLKVRTLNNTTASLDNNSIRMLGGVGYTPSQANTQDILTFVTFDSSYLYGVTGQFFS